MPKDDWAGLYARYAKLVDQWESAYRSGSAALRQFWEEHGCVRCIHEIHHVLWTAGSPAEFKVLKKTLDRFDSPSTRRKDRFYCQKHSVPLEAGVAFYPYTALGQGGHVGFGIRIPDITYQSYPELNEGHCEWYTDSFAVASGAVGPGVLSPKVVADPLKRFRDEEYTAWKPLSSPDGNFEEAVLHTLDWGKSTYVLFGQNCLNEAHDVLTVFGVQGLPVPTLHTPLSWFKHVFQSEEVDLSPPQAQPEVKVSAATASFTKKLDKFYDELTSLGGKIRLSDAKGKNPEGFDQVTAVLLKNYKTRERKECLEHLDYWLRHARFLQETGQKEQRVVITIDAETGFPTGDVEKC